MSDKGGFSFGSPFVMAVQQRRPDGEVKHPVHEIAQATELADRMKRMAVRHSFEYAQLCRQKPGVGTLRTEPVLAFVRYLDMENRQDFEIFRNYSEGIMVNRIDCIVAMLGDDSRSIAFVPHNSEVLEPYTPADPERPASEEPQP